MPRQFHITPATVNAFRCELPHWYRRHRRDLPWRRTGDPYRIWVSEIMLQQTRVEVVCDYYRRWLRAFPTVKALARAPYSRVLKLWEGLGYYSRARNLHRAAKSIRGNLPQTVDELRELPGIGRYTAGAIASIAFGKREPIVDGNVARVFARVFHICANIKTPATQAKLWEIAEQLLPEKDCGDYNQALMELGALVCKPVTPLCGECPVRTICKGRGVAEQLPNRGESQKPVEVVHDVVWVERDGRVLLQRREDGMWELPAGKSGQCLFTMRHTITNHRITLRVWKGTTKLPSGASFRRVETLTLPVAHRRAVNALRGSDIPRRASGGQTRR